ncbi:MAG: hypothetical protein H6626_04420 [Pseudobdellovibrionaceae bacterium]|nr:MAG: hypothetical protein H6626_04420 [Pseudobdellovibrionaceae bacterium]
MKHLGAILLCLLFTACTDNSKSNGDGTTAPSGKLVSGLSLLKSQYSSAKLSCQLKLTVDDNLGNIDKATRIVDVELLDDPQSWPSMAGLSAHVDHMVGTFGVDDVKIELFEWVDANKVAHQTPVVEITGNAVGNWAYLDTKTGFDRPIYWELFPEDPNQLERHFRHEYSYTKENGPAVINYYDAHCRLSLKSLSEQ